MKKRVNIVIAAAMALALTGCSLADIRTENANPSLPDTVDTSTIPITTINEGTEPGANTEPDTPGNPATPEIVYEGAYAIFSEQYDTIYVIDSYDRKIDTFDSQRFKNSAAYKDSNSTESSFVGYLDGIYYFLCDNRSDKEFYTTLYAIDGKTDETAVVCHYSENETVTSVDVYNDKLYVTFYTSGNKENKYSEDVYSKAEGSLSYTLEEGNQNAFLGKIKASTIFTNSTNSAHHWRDNDSVERSIDSYGFVLAEMAGQYERINAGGTVQVFDIPYSGVTMWGYDERYLAFTAYNDEYYGCYIYCYDMQTDAYYTVGNADATYLGYADGYLYYAEDESDEYGYRNNHIYKFDPSNGMILELYDLYATPGCRELNPGVTGFSYIDDHALFLQCTSGKIGWEAVYYDEAGATYKNLDCTVAEVNALKYGSVSHTSIMKDCDFCNARLMNYYTEIFQLDESYSKEYEAINDYLRKQELDNYDDYIGDHYEMVDSEACVQHDGLVLASYADISVAHVDIINNKYLTVLYEKDSYSGGAHGSFRSKQYMFDIDSGEAVTIADLYQGTELEFRNFVAEKTRDDYLNDPTRYYQNSLGAQGVYDTAYDAAGYSNIDMEFYADKAVIVYGEYEMGPYAAGEIRIEVTYKELLGRNRL